MGKKVSGKWSTIYAQHLMVELDNGQKFVTNLRYNVKPDKSKDPLTE